MSNQKSICFAIGVMMIVPSERLQHEPNKELIKFVISGFESFISEWAIYKQDIVTHFFTIKLSHG